MFCARCGNEVHGDASFCAACGTGLGAPSTAMQPMVRRPPFPSVPPQLPGGHLPPLVFAGESVAIRRARTAPSNGAVVASWLLFLFAAVGSLVPGFGFGIWLIIGPILVITLILGILSINRGGAIQGVVIILMSLIVIPLFVFVAPIVSTVLALSPGAPAQIIAADRSDGTGFLSGLTAANSAEDSAPVAQVDQTGAADVSQSIDMQERAAERYIAPPVLVAAASAQAQGTNSAEAPKFARAVVSGSGDYVVLRTSPTMFSKGLGRLEPGTELQVDPQAMASRWANVSTADGRMGYLKRTDFEIAR